jgi:allantoin racemase
VKLCWIHPTTHNPQLDPLWAKLADIVDPAMFDGTTIEHRFLPRSGNFTRSLWAEHLNSVHMLEAALKAQDDGFDGVFLGCWNDPLWEAREVLSIPVASVSEQSMLAAMTMGKRFAVVTVSEKTCSAIENDLHAYRFDSRAIARPVRTIMPEGDGVILAEATTDPFKTFIPRFEEKARECIADGAEVILVGCAYYGPLLRAVGYDEIPGTGVAVVDSTTVALKYLEAMTSISMKMGMVKSTRQHLRAPPKEMMQRTREALGLI